MFMRYLIKRLNTYVRGIIKMNENSNKNSHLKIYVNLYFIGLIIYLISLLINPLNIIKLPFNENYLLIPIYIITLVLSGLHVIFEGIEDTIKNTIKKKSFSPNVHILMTLAALGAIIINYYHEAVILILIFAGAHFLEDLVQSKSKNEIEKLLNLNPPHARLIKEDNTIEIINSQDLKKDDLVVVLNGDQIPSDGVIVEGETEINESTITGESMPVLKGINDQVYGSTINNSNKIVVRINKANDETLVAKIIELVKETQTDLSETAKLIHKIEPIYVTLAIIFAPIFYLLGQFVFNWDNAFYRTMVFLIAASPCALAVTDIPATLSALSNLAKRGVLFKGGASLANLADLKAVAFDKTGTLTEGVPSVSDVHFDEQLPEEQKQFYRSIIASMERKANHPLAEAILRHFGDAAIFDMEVDNEIGRGLSSKFQQKTYKIGKPSIVGEVSSQLQEVTNRLENEGKTVVYFCEEDKVICVIGIQDAPKDSAKKAIQYFKTENIYTVMLSGDAERTAKAIGEQL